MESTAEGKGAIVTTTKPSYPMSSAGGCLRSLAVARLGYEQKPRPEFLDRAAKEGDRAEVHIAEDLRAEGFWVSEGVRCEVCGRGGEHVEIPLPAFNLVGHLDRYIRWPYVGYAGGKGIAEFKALNDQRSRSLWSALAKVEDGNPDPFITAWPEYATQISLYQHATGLPALYCVKARGTGELRKFLVPRPVVPLEDIVSRLLEAEVCVRKGVLPPCNVERGSFWDQWCAYAYLHEHEAAPLVPANAKAVEIAAGEWRIAKRVMEQAEKDMEEAKNILVQAAESMGTQQGYFHGLKVTRVRGGTKVSYPKEKLERLVPKEYLDLVAKVGDKKAYWTVEDSQGGE